MRGNNNHHSTQAEDEALALALQMQFEREAQATAPPMATVVSTSSASGRPPSRGRSRPSSSVVSDEEIARRVQQQEEEAYRVRMQQQQSQHRTPPRPSSRSRSRTRPASPAVPVRTRSSSRTRATSPAPLVVNAGAPPPRARSSSRSRPTTSGGYVFPAPDNGRTRSAPVASSLTDPGEEEYPSTFADETPSPDAELARRMEQEMQDELVAERLQQREQRRANQQAAVRLQAASTQPRRRRKICGSLVTVAVLVGAVVALVYYFVILGGSVPSINLTPEDFAEEDPFDAIGPEDAKRWRNSGNGVELTVLNALETKWYQYFYDAVDDWDDGYPDTLSLTTEFREYEKACQTENYKVKVCNGDYGNTRWKGINEVIIDSNDEIIASSARMNEFYMPDRDDTQWQYTMCHELGHAWGLPHTDENFNNDDLGDCMDYTNNPEANKQPTIRNFNFLFQLYGLVPGAEPYEPPTPAPTPATVILPQSPTVSIEQQVGVPATTAPDEEETTTTGNDKKNNDNRQLRSEPRAAPTRRTSNVRGASSQEVPPPVLLQTRKPSIDPQHRALAEQHGSTFTNQVDPLPEWLSDAIANAWDRDSGNRRLTTGWKTLHQHERGESHEVALPRGYKLQVHKLLATTEEVERFS
eukprot:CAMPEP_0172455410 /NCGR_PEP_ID=MMETSP1065-20121228/12049_1 /TAXON_ID=265537 /ORGANISM="Amphiprora paludosa, Strain CCMP125" /LENGTH=639 /DNA_ID=CAMNT_0013207871 /DNA_START=388 /DNA_END=2307 /DNA_ORIENTATION=+